MLRLLWLQCEWFLDCLILAKGGACDSPFRSHPLDTYDGELSVIPVLVPTTARLYCSRNLLTVSL